MELLPLLLLLFAFSSTLAEGSPGKYQAVRLKPGQDLKESGRDLPRALSGHHL